MNKRKHYGRKIKKTKNLYRRKKTAGQKAFGTVMLVLAVSAVAFLGFCIGKPLLDYLGNIGTEEKTQFDVVASYKEKQEADVPEDSPDAEEIDITESAEESGPVTEIDVRGDHDTAVSSEAASSEASAPAPVIPESGVFSAVEVPSGALANRSSLSAILAKAKAGGYSAAIVQLKDRSGYFHYKTSIEGAEELISGSMTLDEIMSVFREYGLAPVAEMAVLSDNMGCKTFTEMSFKLRDGSGWSWLDRYGNRWADPQNSATREYFAQISVELITAGFDSILLTDVMYPEVTTNDDQYDLSCAAPDRYKSLYNVIKAGNIIEVRASDVLAETYGRTAEILYDTSKLHDNKIALVISRTEFTVEAGYPADAKSLVENVLSLVSQKTGNVPIIPVIDGQSFDDAEKAKITAALADMGYDSYIMR